MRFMTTWKARPGALREAVDRFLAGQGQPPAGVTMLARWHKVDCSGGYTLAESDNPSALYELSAQWADVLEIESCPVIEDTAAGTVLAKVFRK
jgi:hypothetical protein